VRLLGLHDRTFAGRPRLAAGFLPLLAVALAATLALTAWQLAPGKATDAEAPDPAPSGLHPDAPAVSANPAGGRPGSTGGSSVLQTVAVPRVPRAATTGRFPSGVSAASMRDVNAWASFRGRAVDVVVTYSTRTSWRSIIHPWVGIDAAHLAGFPGAWVISQPLFPDSGPEQGNLTACAAGQYNAKWREFGAWLVARGRGNSFVRLGWEFNGNWFGWSATDPPRWIACFRNAVSSIRATSPSARIDWTLNAHGSATPVDAFDLYPGDAYVDVVGVDSYDHYPPSFDGGSFDEQCHGTDGLCHVIDFARAHNKLFSVPEWGVVGKDGTRAGMAGQAGGDNPIYVEKMHDVFVQNADILAYEAYFNDDTPNNVHSALWNPVLHPMSSATYRRLWRSS
jgi:hypothetical protein